MTSQGYHSREAVFTKIGEDNYGKKSTVNTGKTLSEVGEQFVYISWLDVVAPASHYRNYCVIEHLSRVFILSLCFFIFCWCIKVFLSHD